jgi:hypothetical protein
MIKHIPLMAVLFVVPMQAYDPNLFQIGRKETSEAVTYSQTQKVKCTQCPEIVYVTQEATRNVVPMYVEVVRPKTGDAHAIVSTQEPVGWSKIQNAAVPPRAKAALGERCRHDDIGASHKEGEWRYAIRADNGNEMRTRERVLEKVDYRESVEESYEVTKYEPGKYFTARESHSVCPACHIGSAACATASSVYDVSAARMAQAKAAFETLRQKYQQEFGVTPEL